VAEVRRQPAAAGHAAEAGLHRHPALRTTQAPERDDILNIGGFSDAVFSVVASFLSGDAGRFVAEVESIELYQPVLTGGNKTASVSEIPTPSVHSTKNT
jgi:hypothetical protein